MLGLRDLWDERRVRAHILHSKNYNAEREDPDDASSLAFFRTLRQQTWLVATRERLYCILDDARKPEPHINWSIPRNEIVSNDEVILRVEASASRKGSSVLAFGPRHQQWLYSKGLFGLADPATVIQDLLREKMTASV
jgi:hypothetical protein